MIVASLPLPSFALWPSHRNHEGMRGALRRGAPRPASE